MTTFEKIFLMQRMFRGNTKACGILKDGKWSKLSIDLTGEVGFDLFFRHLMGEICIGIYPIFQNHVIFFALDIDKKGEIGAQQIKRLKQSFECSGLHPSRYLLVEETFRGFHIWGFLRCGRSSEVIFEYLHGIVVRAGLTMNKDIEVYPKQPKLLCNNSYGNLIKLPFCIDRGHRCGFVDDKNVLFSTNKRHWDALKGVTLIEDDIIDCGLHRNFGILRDLRNRTSIPKNGTVQEHIIKISHKKMAYLLSKAPPCILAIWRDGAAVGMRNEATVRLASYLYHSGFREELVKSFLSKWNISKNGQGGSSHHSNEEVKSSVHSVFTRGYRFGCADSVLKEYCLVEVCPLKK